MGHGIKGCLVTARLDVQQTGLECRNVRKVGLVRRNTRSEASQRLEGFGERRDVREHLGAWKLLADCLLAPSFSLLTSGSPNTSHDGLLDGSPDGLLVTSLRASASDGVRVYSLSAR